MNIIETMDDPGLFASLFAATSWRPWRAFLNALFGLAMDEKHSPSTSVTPAAARRLGRLFVRHAWS